MVWDDEDEWCLWDYPFKCPYVDVILSALEREGADPSFLDELCNKCALRLEYITKPISFIV